MASRSLGTLTLDLVAKVGGFTAGMTAAERAADKSLSAIERRAYKFGQTLGTGLKAAGVAAVAGFTALAASLQITINSLDELSKSAQKIGTTTEELSKLAYAGDLADVSLETLTSTLGKLTKAQAEALDEGSKTAQIFDALGVSVKNADGTLRASTDVLGDFAEVFKQLNGSPEAVAAGFQIFGRSFQELIPLLKDGREGIEGAGDELERFGGVISTQAGQAAEEFNDNLTRLKVQFQAILAQIAQQLLPTLVDLSSQLVKVAKDGDLVSNAVTVISSVMQAGVGIINFYNGAVERLSIAFETANGLGSGFVELQKNILSFGATSGTVANGFNKMVDAITGGQKRLDALGQRENAPVVDFSGVSGSVSSTEQTADEANAAKAEARLAKLIAALNGSTDAKKKNAKATKELTEAEKAYKEQEELFAEIAEMTARYQTDQIIRQGELDKQREESTASLLEDLEFERSLLGKTVEDQEILNNLRYAGVDANSEYGQSIIQVTKDLQEQRDAMEQQIAVADVFRSNFEDAFADVLTGTKSVKDAFKDMTNQILADIARIVAQKLVENFFGASGSASGGQAGGWIQAFGSLFGGARATGGSVNAGQFYRVNENGPELLTVGGREYLMMGNQSGMVSKSEGASGVTVVQNITTPGRIDKRTASQLAQESAVKLRVATVRNS